MKLLRVGEKGQEKVAAVDSENLIRDLSQHLEDLDPNTLSEVTLNKLAQIAIDCSGKDIKINNIDGQDFIDKYGFPCPLGVKGRNSDNRLYLKKIGWEPSMNLREGMEITFKWINEQVNGK